MATGQGFSWPGVKQELSIETGGNGVLIPCLYEVPGICAVLHGSGKHPILRGGQMAAALLLTGAEGKKLSQENHTASL